jgi:hypothetical protein
VVEHRPYKARVTGSIPVASIGTTQFKVGRTPATRPTGRPRDGTVQRVGGASSEQPLGGWSR